MTFKLHTCIQSAIFFSQGYSLYYYLIFLIYCGLGFWAWGLGFRFWGEDYQLMEFGGLWYGVSDFFGLGLSV